MAEHTTPKVTAKPTTSNSLGQSETALPILEQAPFVHQLRNRPPTPSTLTASDVLYLQRTAGNRAVQQLLPRQNPKAMSKEMSSVALVQLPAAELQKKIGLGNGNSLQRTPSPTSVQVHLRTSAAPIQRSLKAFRKAKLARRETTYLEEKLLKIKAGQGSVRRKLGLRSAKKAIDSLYAELKSEAGIKALLDPLVDRIFGSDYRTMEKMGGHEGLLSGSDSSDSESYSSPPSESEEDGHDRVLEAVVKDPSPTKGSSSKEFHQGVVSKGMAKKDLGSDLYHGVSLVKTSDKLEGGDARTAVRSVWEKVKEIEASISRLIPTINSDSGGGDGGIWETVKTAIMSKLEAASAWAEHLKDTIDPSGIVSSSISLLKAIYDAVKLGLTQDKQKSVLYRSLNDGDFELAHSLKWVLSQTVKRWIVMGRTLAASALGFTKSVLQFIPVAQSAAPFLGLSAAFISYGPKIFNRIRQWYRDRYNTKKSMVNKTSVAAHHGGTLVDAVTKNVSGSTIREGDLDMELVEALGMSPTDFMDMGSSGGIGSKVKGAVKGQVRGVPGMKDRVGLSEEESESSGRETHISKVVSKVVGHSRYDPSLDRHFRGDFSERQEESMSLLGGSQRSDEMPDLSIFTGAREESIDEDMERETEF